MAEDLYKYHIDLAAQLAQSLNSYAVNEQKAGQAFARALRIEHRTLQQSTCRFLLGFFREVASWEDHWFDGRNEAMRDWCRMVDKESEHTYLPLV